MMARAMTNTCLIFLDDLRWCAICLDMSVDQLTVYLVREPKAAETISGMTKENTGTWTWGGDIPPVTGRQMRIAQLGQPGITW